MSGQNGSIRLEFPEFDDSIDRIEYGIEMMLNSVPAVSHGLK